MLKSAIYKLIGFFLYRNKKFMLVYLKGGLCNKLYCLFSACEIALNNGYQIIEPEFGWKKKILFSEIYDLPKFNDNFRELNNGKDLIIPHKKRKYLRSANLFSNFPDLWKFSEEKLASQRKTTVIAKNDLNIIVLNALKLNTINQNIANSYQKNQVAIQIRTESDWEKHAAITPAESGENMLINPEILIKMVAEKNISENYFFTSGENHSSLLALFKANNILAKYFYEPNLEYEINAAINFEICCSATAFIGLSRSTFSNLITLKRAVLGKDNSYIYNLNNELYLRKDKGLYTNPFESIGRATEFN